MMELEQQLLQVSAKLYRHLGEEIQGEERDAYLKTADRLFDERGQLIASIQQAGIKLSEKNPQHVLLKELDQGIQERMKSIMAEVKQDLKNVQTTKKSEVQYTNPYSSVQVMDGRYYDRKK